MDRFPVGRAIAHAYGFLIRRIFTVIALSWVAAALYAALRFALFRTEPLLQPWAHPEIAAFHLAGVFASLLLLSVIAVSLTRAALGEHKDWALAHFVIGGREIRLFATLLVLTVLFIVAIVAAVAAVLGAAWGVAAAMAQWPSLGQTGLPVAQIAHWGATVLASLAAIYVTLRVSFLLFPVAAVEEHASLARAWQLGSGNVLRMLAVALAVVVPVYLIFAACEYALLGSDLVAAARGLFAAGPHDPAPFVALLASHAEAVSIGSAIMLVVMTALNAGASASAYAALTGRASAEAVVPETEAHGMQDAHGHDTHGHEAHGHDDHGHGDHGAADHGHDAHGDDAPGHDAHGHAEEPHGHDDHAHEAHAEEAHGDDGHGHDAPAHGDHAAGHADHDHDPHGHDGHDAAAEVADGHDVHGAHDEHGAQDHHGDHGHDAVAHGHDDHGHGTDHDSHHHAADALELTDLADDVPAHAQETRVLEHA